MSLYEQEPEIDLFAALVPRLRTPLLIDVGAERGEVSSALLDAGIQGAHLIEPDPTNAVELRARFRGDARVVVHELAAGTADGRRDLHLSTDRSGQRVSYLHTLEPRLATETVGWDESISVEYRSLSSLVASGAVPSRVGIVKIDTEGHDLSVVRGMDGLSCDVISVEHWTDLPDTLGRCPWSVDELRNELRARSFENFAAVVHSGPFTTLRWNDAELVAGEYANLVFFENSFVETAILPVLVAAGALAKTAVAHAAEFVSAAAEREGLVKRLHADAAELRELVGELDDEAGKRLAIILRLEADLTARSKRPGESQA